MHKVGAIRLPLLFFKVSDFVVIYRAQTLIINGEKVFN